MAKPRCYTNRLYWLVVWCQLERALCRGLSAGANYVRTPTGSLWMVWTGNEKERTEVAAASCYERKRASRKGA